METIYSLSQRTYENAWLPGGSSCAPQISRRMTMWMPPPPPLPPVGKIAAAVARRIGEVASVPRESASLSNPGAIDFSYALRPGREQDDVPLLKISSGQASWVERWFLHRESGATVRLGYALGEGAPPIYSGRIPWAVGATHTLRLSASGLYPVGEPGLKQWLLVRLDGAPFWEVPVEASDEPPGQVVAEKDVSLTRESATPSYLSRNLVGELVRCALPRAGGALFPAGDDGEIRPGGPAVGSPLRSRHGDIWLRSLGSPAGGLRRVSIRI